MFKFPNGSEYRLLLVDTNILSNIVKNRNNEKELFTTFIKEHTFAPCFSFQSILEIKNSSNNGNTILFDNFLDCFSQFPCISLFPYRMLTNQEIKHTLNGEKIDISKCMNAFSVFGKDDSYNFELWCDKILTGVQHTIQTEELENMAFAKEMEVERRTAIKSDKPMLYPNFEKGFFDNFFACEEKSLMSKSYDAESYPAIAMMAITKFDRVYRTPKRTLGVNDVNDIFISAYIPYMDAIIMENHQVDVVRQRKSRFRFLQDIQLFTMRDIFNR